MSRAPHLPPRLAGLPRAANDQYDVQEFEDALLVKARLTHPSVTWWHGYRRSDDDFGSYCYLCDRFIVTWGGNSGPPKVARASIDEHKHTHRPGNRPARSARNKGAQPA